MCPAPSVIRKLKPSHSLLSHVSMLDRSGIIGLKIQWTLQLIIAISQMLLWELWLKEQPKTLKPSFWLLGPSRRIKTRKFLKTATIPPPKSGILLEGFLMTSGRHLIYFAISNLPWKRDGVPQPWVCIKLMWMALPQIMVDPPTLEWPSETKGEKPLLPSVCPSLVSTLAWRLKPLQ